MKLSTTNYFIQGRKSAAMVAATATTAGILALTACDPGPECLDYSTQVVPHTTIVKGKVVSGTSVVTTCVRYAEDGNK
ncbi:hypothetical protein ACFRLW_37270 [Streptomyces sp. NPDC056728]